jgi:hypothetical protein
MLMLGAMASYLKLAVALPGPLAVGYLSLIATIRLVTWWLVGSPSQRQGRQSSKTYIRTPARGVVEQLQVWHSFEHCGKGNLPF